MNNKKAGNEFERELCELLSKKGFWVHNFANKATGQPVDIIACKCDTAVLIDAKDCANDRFDSRRIEENQKCAISLWVDCSNSYACFALRLSDGEIYMVDKCSMFVAIQERRTLNREHIIDIGIPFSEWAVRLDWKLSSVTK